MQHLRSHIETACRDQRVCSSGPKMIVRARSSCLRRALPAIAILTLATPTLADDEVKARGVNPADNDTRLDVVIKNNWLRGSAGLFSTTLKYDQRLTPAFGLNIEMPVFGAFNSPIAGTDVRGVGDVFARLRYIHPIGRLSVGGALEAVFPTATAPALGLQAYQLNVAGLAVYAWSDTVITAVVGKAVQSIGETDRGLRFQENTARLIQAFILPEARFVTFDVKYNWSTMNLREVWWETQVEVGTMLDARTSASIALARRFGDRLDNGALSLTMKRFF